MTMHGSANQLTVVHQAVQNMLAAGGLAERLQIMARALRQLGWGRISLSVYDGDLLIVEPPLEGLQLEEALQAHVAAVDTWQNYLQNDPGFLERNRLGAGYFFSRHVVTETEPVIGAQPNGRPYADSTLFIPLTLGTGKLVGSVTLDEASTSLQPDALHMQLIDLLIAQALSAIENSRLRTDLDANTEKMQAQIEELVMMQRVEVELSATLNFDNVMNLTMDWAIRRTGATAGMLSMITADGTSMITVAALGYPFESVASTNNPQPITGGIIGRAMRTREIQIVKEVEHDPDYQPVLSSTRALVAVPMEMRKRLVGILILESDESNAFDSADIAFIKRLASRAAGALDNARLHREAEESANEMAALYSASRAISGSLERSEVVINAAQALAAVMSVSGIIICEYQPDKLTVTASYRLGTARDARDILPAVGEVLNLKELREINQTLRGERARSIQIMDSVLAMTTIDFMARRRIRSMLILPLIAQSKPIGAAILVEGRRERRFAPDEILMAEALASQVAAALRQAKLYEDVRELEKLKTEMIRMASHDLRNPLSNVIGYTELLHGSLGLNLTEKQARFINNIQRSTNLMKTLIDDLLTLEKVESERHDVWVDVDLGQLSHDVVETQQSSADLKNQTLKILVGEGNLHIAGNATQLRQAVTNLVGNALKYTPDAGLVQVSVTSSDADNRVSFEVQDNGYGISEDKQARLFERFYRAQEPGTDHIPGTGLGLSLVKTVIERHGGEVWVRSKLGVGSTFGFWLPRVMKK